MTRDDLEAVTKAIGPVVREFTAKAVAAAVAPLLEKNAALELRILELETKPVPVIQGPPGPAGGKGDTGAGIGSLVISADGRLLAHLTDGKTMDAGPLPRPEKGEKGDRGDAGAVGPIGPEGKQGLPGPPGERGLDGAPGAHGLDGKAGEPGPPGKDGERGPQGEKGLPGLDGTFGRDGRDGAPGAPGAPGEKGLDGRDGTNGLNGKDGADGLGFDDFDLRLDDTRGWIFSLGQGDRLKEWAIPMPFFKGNWEAGNTYPKGAGVRWDGHYWWALKETHEQPGEGSTTWQIVVSRGKQGREGKQGKDGTPGRDLTQMDPGTGQKW